MKILTVNDIHLSDRPPSSCTDEYTEDLLDLLGQTVKVSVDYRADAVVWTGDVFHSKSPTRNSHRLVQRAIFIGQSYACPWYIVPGNHDLQHDSLDSIHDTQPLGVLYRAGAKMLSGWADDIGTPLYGVPWQQDWANLSRVLAPYRQRVFEEGTGAEHPLVCAHAPLYPPGHELPYENYPAQDWGAEMGGSGFCAYGHVHERHGIWTAGEVTFCNPGALSRGSLHEYNMTRPVQVALFDTLLGQFTEVPLNARPAAEIYRLREKEQVVTSAGKLDDFLAQVGSTRLAALDTASVIEHVRSLGVDPEVTAEVEELMDWAAHQ